jgi:hypothetical protein
MEQSEQQKAILELGKLLVKELGIQKSVDTLSRWMAHYVAEKIKLAEDLPDGAKKKAAEKECFALILDLWKHRWNYKSDRQPLKNFQRLFNILDNLDPNKEEPYYYRIGNSGNEDIITDSFGPEDLKNLTALAKQIDEVARIWIDFVLREEARKANNEQVQKIVNNAVKLPASLDAHIIRIVFSEFDKEEESEVDEAESERLEKIQTLQKRITELKKFKKVNEYITARFEKDLEKLKRVKKK